MKQEILQNISAVINALNIITINGKNNLLNLSGSIGMLEEIYTKLSRAEFKEDE